MTWIPVLDSCKVPPGCWATPAFTLESIYIVHISLPSKDSSSSCVYTMRIFLSVHLDFFCGFAVYLYCFDDALLTRHHRHQFFFSNFNGFMLREKSSWSFFSAENLFWNKNIFVRKALKELLVQTMRSKTEDGMTPASQVLYCRVKCPDVSVWKTHNL